MYTRKRGQMENLSPLLFCRIRGDLKVIDVFLPGEVLVDEVVFQRLQIEDDASLARFAIHTGTDSPDILSPHLDERPLFLQRGDILDIQKNPRLAALDGGNPGRVKTVQFDKDGLAPFLVQ